MQVDSRYPQNAKQLDRVGFAPQEIADGKPDDPNATRYYHPTKGWRRVAVKRSRAAAIINSGMPARGHALQRILRHGY